MPELLRKLPARMNSGTASSAKFCVSVTASWIGIVEGSSGCCRKNTLPEMPIANATGMPSSRRTVKTIRTEQHQIRRRRDSRALRPAQFVADLENVVISSSAAPTGRLIVTQE